MIKRKTAKGFSIFELLIAIAILGYCLSVILMHFINSSDLNESTRNLANATTHAEYVMENIKNTAFINIPSNQNGASWTTWTFNTSGVTGLGLTALRNENINTSLTGINPIDITVTVVWEDKGGRTRVKVLRTLISG